MAMRPYIIIARCIRTGRIRPHVETISPGRYSVVIRRVDTDDSAERIWPDNERVQDHLVTYFLQLFPLFDDNLPQCVQGRSSPPSPPGEAPPILRVHGDKIRSRTPAIERRMAGIRSIRRRMETLARWVHLNRYTRGACYNVVGLTLQFSAPHTRNLAGGSKSVREFALLPRTTAPVMSSAALIDIKRTLRQHLPALRERYGVASLALFGSVVRGTHEPDSDVDVLVTFDDPPGLLAFIELERELGDLLGRPVDLVPEDSLKPRIGDRVRQEAEPV